MYTEEKNEFPIKDLLLKILFLALFVFALMWLFPIGRNNKVVNNVQDSRIFIENVAAMKDAAKNYYTNNKLPKKVGDKASMTLQEMFNKKLLIAFKDANGKACDAKGSYVEITNLDKEYALKVYLSCENQSDYVIEVMSCNDKCCLDDNKQANNDKKEDEKQTQKPTQKPATPKETKTVTEYEYVRPVSTWSAYSAWTTEYKATNDSRKRNEKTQYMGVKVGGWSNWTTTSSPISEQYDSNNYKIREVTTDYVTDYDYTDWKYQYTDRFLNPQYTNDTVKYKFVGFEDEGYNTYYLYEVYTRSVTKDYDLVYKYRTRQVSYTDWVDAIPTGYQSFKTRTVHSYSTKTTKNEYTWSTKTSLSGWTRTGKTRSKKITV